MKSLGTKSLPDELHIRLQARAATHRRSLNQEGITLLEGAVDEMPDPIRDTTEFLRKLRAWRTTLGGPALTAEEIE